MAIYSLSHTPIGKSTQADSYTASAHIAYITRTRALQHLEAARMPENGEDAAVWLKEHEDRDRKNARVADKIMLALPRELSPEQRVALVRAFAEDVTKGRASWLGAFHDNTVDAHNPHCHLVLRDRDPETGKRVIGTSERGSTERFRQAWETHANEALRGAGLEERIDRRTLEAQGIAREPTIHEGVQARKIRMEGRQSRSRSRRYRNGPGARGRVRDVRYHEIDQGRSRHAYNEQRRRARESEAELWAAVDDDGHKRDLQSHRAIQRPHELETDRDRYRRYLAEFTASRQSLGLDHDRDREPDD